MPQSIYQGETYIGETIQATIGNLLTANQAGGTDALGATTGFDTLGSGSAISSSSVIAWQGTKSVRVVASGTGNATHSTSPGPAGIPVIPGETYTGTLRARMDAGQASAAINTIYLRWWTAAGAGISLTSSPIQALTNGAWTTFTVSGVAPPTAAFVSLAASFQSFAAGQVAFTDGWGLWKGAGGDWAMPGIPIQNSVGAPTWKKMPVMNWVDGNWIQLNANIGPVDFAVRNVTHDRALIEIHDSGNYDHTGDYRVWLRTGAVTNPFVLRPDLAIADNTSTKEVNAATGPPIVRLTANTDYAVRINVDLISGGVTPDSDQTFKTKADPTPFAVVDLRSPARTNTWIDLAWTKPAGSSASSYRVVYGRQGEGPAGTFNVPSASTYRVTGLRENTKYWYYVQGVTSAGYVGPNSNRLQWATGWGEIRRQGSDDNIIWKPREWGSYRRDIEWRWARENGVLDKNPHLFQGYWPGSNWHGASNPSSNLEAGRTRRYWGTVVYDKDYIRDKLDAKHGNGVGEEMVISKLSFRRLYRHTNPGNIAAQNMIWHLTSSNPFNSSQPPTYGTYDGVAMRAGDALDYYRLPGSWGTKLIDGRDGGTAVNGIVLHRSDDQTNGYGAAGYGRWSGHMLHDPDTSGSWRHSDLSLMMEGSWNVLVRAYKGPYQW